LHSIKLKVAGYLSKNKSLVLSTSDAVFPSSMWVALERARFFGAEMRTQTWKWTITDARSDDHWHPRRPPFSKTAPQLTRRARVTQDASELSWVH